MDSADSANAKVTATTDLRNQILVVQGKDAELAFAQVVIPTETFNLFNETFHPPTLGEMSPAVNMQWGKFRECRTMPRPCDISPVADIESIRSAIEDAMAEKGFSRRSLSSAAGLSESAVRDLLTRTDNPGIGTLTRIAEALEMPVDLLTGAAAMVPILGAIGAGGEVLFSTDPDNEYDEGNLPKVPRPPLVVGRLMALRVSGSSMLPKYEDGEIIYVRRDHDGVMPSYIGRYCAVRTGDDGTYLKVLATGSEPGRYTLRSLNAPDMENVEVIWASPVLFVMPNGADG